jgi:hypothetical protein
MKFDQLEERDQIKQMKVEFNSILEKLVEDISKLNNIISNELNPEEENKIRNAISKIEKKKGCICDTCLDIDFTNKVIPDDLRDLIDYARKEAESKEY